MKVLMGKRKRMMKKKMIHLKADVALIWKKIRGELYENKYGEIPFLTVIRAWFWIADDNISFNSFAFSIDFNRRGKGIFSLDIRLRSNNVWKTTYCLFREFLVCFRLFVCSSTRREAKKRSSFEASLCSSSLNLFPNVVSVGMGFITKWCDCLIFLSLKYWP